MCLRTALWQGLLPAHLIQMPHQHSRISEIHKEEREDEVMVGYRRIKNKIAEKDQRGERFEPKSGSKCSDEVFVLLHTHSPEHDKVYRQCSDREESETSPDESSIAIKKGAHTEDVYDTCQYECEAERF